jgi:dihydroorotase
LSLFNPEGESTFTKDAILSKSKNSAFIGMELKGKAYGIVNQQKLTLA